VTLAPVDGDINTLAITGRVHSDQDKPPVARSGEIVMQHTSGSQLKFAADGSVAVVSSAGLTINSGGTLDING
jgi:hypothetical protein